MTFTNVLENLSKQWVSTVFNDAERYETGVTKLSRNNSSFFAVVYNSMGCSLLVNSPWIMCLCNMLTKVTQDIVGQV